jgi:hypothetical protein
MARIRPVLLFLAGLILVTYLADYLAARTNPLGTVQVQPYYAVHLKDKKTEFDFDVPAESTSCAQSLAPHLGYPPCWYLRRHTTRRIEN